MKQKYPNTHMHNQKHNNKTLMTIKTQEIKQTTTRNHNQTTQNVHAQYKPTTTKHTQTPKKQIATPDNTKRKPCHTTDNEHQTYNNDE